MTPKIEIINCQQEGGYLFLFSVTFSNLWLPILYLWLSFLTYGDLRLPLVGYHWLPFLTFPYFSLPFLTFPYISLPFPTSTRAYRALMLLSLSHDPRFY